MEKALQNKIEKNLVYMVDTAISRQIDRNRYSERIGFAEVIEEIFNEDLVNDSSGDLKKSLRKKVSQLFYDHINCWKQHKIDLPLVFTKDRMNKGIAKLSSKFLVNHTPSSLKQHIVEMVVEDEQDKQVVQKDNNIVLFKIDALKENYFTVTYANVSNGEKEYLSKQVVNAAEILNQRRREFT
jgi:hypothetical protein